MPPCQTVGRVTTRSDNNNGTERHTLVIATDYCSCVILTDELTSTPNPSTLSFSHTNIRSVHGTTESKSNGSNKP